MKRLTLYNIINLIILCLFISLIVFEVYKPMFGIDPKDFWFPCFLLCVGLSLLIKSIIYKSDSSLWFAITFLFIGAIIYVIICTDLTFYNMWPALFSAPAFSSLVLTIFFKDFLHLKIFTFLTIVSISLYLLTFSVVSVWWFIPTFIFSFVLAFFICAILPERFYYKKKEK